MSVGGVSMEIRYDGHLRCTSTHGPSGQTLGTDAPVDNGGKGAAFSPTDLVASALGQTPFDPSSVFFLTIVPLIATFLGGFRHGVRWALVEVVLGVAALQLGHRGYSFSDRDTDLALTMSLNFTFLLVLAIKLVIYVVGYFEEEAVPSYTLYLAEINAGRSPNVPAPVIAKQY